MRRFLCWLIGHRGSRYTDPRYAIRYYCERCCTAVPGGLALKEARR